MHNARKIWAVPTLIAHTHHLVIPTTMPNKCRDTLDTYDCAIPHKILCKRAVFPDIATQSDNLGHN